MALSLKPSINWLFLFIPVTLLLERSGSVAPPVVFFSAALAIVPIASLIVRATEQLSTHTGEAIGGLLNATFGNAPELIIATVALRAGLFDMVLASLIGAILANLLLALGIAFLLGGLRYHDQDYSAGATRIYTSMMLMAVISLVIPSSFSRFFASTDEFIQVEHSLNLALAISLLAAYVLYLVFMIKTHPALFARKGGKSHAHVEGKPWSIPQAVGALLAASVLAAWMSEVLVEAAHPTGKALGMSDTFIGIVFLAIVGGAAESGSAIAMALKNKVDLTVGIALGSSIQIALFVAPLLVLLSYVMAPQPLTLAFGRPELGSLFLAVLIGALVAGDGRGNWYKGVQLITVYATIAMLFYFIPEEVR